MLSVVLATYNEEKNLPACLESVVDIADELIVVDGSSTDDTVKVAQAAGANVISTTNKSNFHINKQMAVDAAKGELILQLDADEVVDHQLQAAIQKIHQNVDYYRNTPDSAKGWWLKRKNLFLGRFLTKGGQYPDPVIRLFVAGYGSFPARTVHEQIAISGSTETLDGHLIHYSNRTFGEYLRKFNTYTSLTAEHLQADSQKLSAPFLLKYFLFKPVTTFASLYLRHRGYVDGVPGFVFAVMSALHHPVAALKLWELYEVERLS